MMARVGRQSLRLPSAVASFLVAPQPLSADPSGTPLFSHLHVGSCCLLSWCSAPAAAAEPARCRSPRRFTDFVRASGHDCHERDDPPTVCCGFLGEDARTLGVSAWWCSGVKSAAVAVPGGCGLSSTSSFGQGPTEDANRRPFWGEGSVYDCPL